MKFLFTCGGTAGHINPAVALAGKIRALLPDAQILFVGAKGQMETRRVPEAGFEIITVQITNLQRSLKPDKILHNLKTVKNIFSSYGEAKKILKDFSPDVVIGTGGYVCYPVIKAASHRKIPTILHESNAVPGVTTKLLAPKVDCMLTGFHDDNGYYQSSKRVIYTGTPVRTDFSHTNQEQAKRDLGLPTDKPLVLSVWGSLGSSRMNEMMEEFIPLSAENPEFHLIHATGEREFQTLLSHLGGVKALPGNVDVREYIHDMHRVMSAADLIMCRAGASTLSEIAILGKPAILVPSPNVTNNHQEKNARALEKNGAAKVLLEGEFDAYALQTLVRNLIADQKKMEQISRCMHEVAKPDATEKITEIILELAMNH